MLAQGVNPLSRVYLEAASFPVRISEKLAGRGERHEYLADTGPSKEKKGFEGYQHVDTETALYVESSAH